MKKIPCACQAYRLSLEQLWDANVDTDKQPCYLVYVVGCKYASILGAYNRWYIVYLVVLYTSLIDTDVDYIEDFQEELLMVYPLFSLNMFLSPTMVHSRQTMWQHLAILLCNGHPFHTSLQNLMFVIHEILHKIFLKEHTCTRLSF